MDPGSGPRSRSLKTRIVKKELAATANCRVGRSCGSEADSIQAVDIKIHRDAAAFDDHPLKSAGRPVMFICLDWAET